MADRLTGTVKRILPDKGFGFLEAPDGIEYFFHRSAFLHASGTPDFVALQVDDLVSFEVNPDAPKGPRAEAVRLELSGVDRSRSDQWL